MRWRIMISLFRNCTIKMTGDQKYEIQIKKKKNMKFKEKRSKAKKKKKIYD